MSSQSQVNVGSGVGPSSQSQVNIGSGPRPRSQDGVSQFQDPAPLSLPQLNRLVEASFVWDESSVSHTDVPVIPSQLKVTHQILSHWEPLRDLKSRFVRSRRSKQLSLRSQQRPLRTPYFGRKWLTLSLWKRMTPSASSSTSPWVVWDRSGLTVEMRPGLLVSDRHSFLPLWVPRSQ